MLSAENFTQSAKREGKWKREIPEKTMLSKLFYLPSEKDFTLKGKNLFPLRVNTYLLE